MKRTWGRVYDNVGNWTWTEVHTDAEGKDDYVWITTLIQVLKLSINESPFYADYGIPAQRSVLQQIFPDFYVWATQRQFSQYFGSLIIAKLESPTPTYRVNVTTNSGVKMAFNIPV